MQNTIQIPVPAQVQNQVTLNLPIKFPLEVFNIINDYVQSTYHLADIEFRIGLINRLIELFMYIKFRHVHVMTKRRDDFSNAPDNLKEVYANIKRTEFQKFNYNNKWQKLQVNELIGILRQKPTNPNLIKDYPYLGLIQVNDSYSNLSSKNSKGFKYPKSYRPRPSIDINSTVESTVDFTRILRAYESKEDLINAYPTHAHAIKSLYLLHCDLESYLPYIDSQIGKVYTYNKKGKTCYSN